eukprot:5272066-Amphidinium_carterae.1
MAEFMEGYRGPLHEPRGRPIQDMSRRAPVSRSRSPHEPEYQDIGTNFVRATIREQNHRLVERYTPDQFHSCFHCHHFVLQR